MMTEGQYGNSSPLKTTENGFKRKPPYSVETPYGFCLDLDFLKYVDDIEKGNTIKRVPIHRRSKGPRSSTLPRHLNLSGGGCRPSPWGSTGALGPRSRLSEADHGYSSWTHDRRTPASPPGLRTLTEMEARIKAFDEQPVGEHIGPHLLRASSMPLTVLLRQTSETAEDPGSLRSSRDHLGERDSSCEDIPRNLEFSGLLRRLTEALERVGELEMEMRVIPELKAQICILQEERERLRLGLHPLAPQPESGNGTVKDPSISSWSQATGDLKRHSNGCPAFPQSPRAAGQDSDNPLHEWRSSTDLDELLTVTSLQAKVAALEQRLHLNGLELQRALRELGEQREEGQRKDERIEHFSVNPMIWVCAEKVVVDSDDEDGTITSTGDKAHSLGDSNKSAGEQTIAFPHGQRNGQQASAVCLPQKSNSSSSSSIPMELEEAQPGAVDSTRAVLHIRRIKLLLEEQWECLCRGSGSLEAGRPLEHPDPEVNRLQLEMMGLVNVLLACYHDLGRSEGDRTPQEAPKSTRTATDESAVASKDIHFAGVNERCSETDQVSQDRLAQGDPSDQKDEPHVPEEMPFTQMYPQASEHRQGETVPDPDPDPDPGPGQGEAVPDPDPDPDPGQGSVPGGEAPGGADGGAGPVVLGRHEQMESSAQGEQMETDSGSPPTTRGSEAVSEEFMAACQFLKDHMENMDNPNNDMRKALVVLFHHWFGVAAEENAAANSVSLYLGEVKKTTPPLLCFLVNLADDNGNTALHYSLSHCNYSVVSLLLETGVSDVDLQNKAGYTAVMLASLTAPDGPGGVEVVRRLMELGDVNISSSQTGQTALHLAVRHGRVVMVRLLLSFGARADVQDTQGTTALMFACERGHTHIVRLLLERGHCDLALTDKRGLTALSLAAQGSHADTASLLQAHAKARAL
ncbi:KN motif and ankyrin repeat domain-containing protein 2-like [Gadus chalcogrammus]|uniref:KN motif and ankyrin repeat domain-containing protein 2-like n=1 Tax=Gadus chalcogrammus TaxID=1042646 RepID=UPI0024C4C4DF|nr:KN motif and ankyrin repeat domain-containing protein 2-like [Gadus chalcogrammus]